MLIVLFLVSHFNFLFVPCGGLSWLPISFLLHVKYTLSYRIVSFVYCVKMAKDTATECKEQTVPKKVKRSKVKEIIVLIKARSFLDELNLEHLTS